MRVFTTPAAVDVNLTADPVTGAFSGVYTVPTGTYTVTAEAYAGAVLVATGTSGQVPVAKGATAQVELTLLDATGPVNVPDHSPWITSFVVAQSSAQVDDTFAVNGAARDMDNDPLTFAWTATPAGCGTFASASSAATTFTARTVGACSVQLAVTARGKTDTRSASVNIATATGSLDITGTYIPRPLITEIAALEGANVRGTVARTDTDATVRTPLVRSTTYNVRVRFQAVQSGGTLVLSNDCGATMVQPTFTGSGSEATGTWTAPASGATCVVTATLTRAGLTDTFPVMFVFNP